MNSSRFDASPDYCAFFGQLCQRDKLQGHNFCFQHILVTILLRIYFFDPEDAIKGFLPSGVAAQMKGWKSPHFLVTQVQYF